MKSVSFKKPPVQKNPSLIRLVVSIQYRLVTDGRTDRRTDGRKDRRTHYDDTCIYRASI